jgi:hypothetical protein
MPAPVICAICHKPIEPPERRFADFDRVTKAQQHVHIDCMKEGQSPAALTSPLQRLSARMAFPPRLSYR